ncbi:hypothetical protein E3N88_21653 [Mikania micrantha]|uniref:Retrovirus-related Pol polyprotein from transposon TNT 1-94-like beta-barrel domain-containing protein n=1 Tax=Mikania micrantha TaxID=192012 RepID=A0A5N6N850_9ASTR|nr:hypothetical protein E3N88_21653 [Mikania micrantha]
MQSRRKPPCSGYRIIFLLCFLFVSTTVTARPFVLILSQDDLKDGPVDDSFDDPSSVVDWDEFGESDAEAAVNSFLISKDSPVIEPVRIHNGAEENKDALKKSRGEDDEDFLILEYQAQKGNAAAMYKIGIFYYFGLRGVRRDHAKALSWFSKAVDKGEARSMELLGEIYARGAGVKRNYTKALEWLTLASKQQLYSAYNGMGYLYVKGYGVEQKNYTKVSLLKLRINIVLPTSKNKHHEPEVSLEVASLFLRGRGKTVYILPSSDPTLALLMVAYTEYDNDDDEVDKVGNFSFQCPVLTPTNYPIWNKYRSEEEDNAAIAYLCQSLPEDLITLKSTILISPVDETVLVRKVLISLPGRLKAYEERRSTKTSNSNSNQPLLSYQEWETKRKLEKGYGRGRGRGNGQDNLGRTVVVDTQCFRCDTFVHFSFVCLTRKNETKAHLTQATMAKTSQANADKLVLLMAIADQMERELIYANEDKVFSDKYWSHGDVQYMWYIDTKAKNHMIRNKSLFSTLDTKIEGKAIFRDILSVEIEGKGSILLECKNGEQRHNEPEVSLEATSQLLRGICKAVYMLALLMVGYTEYNDNALWTQIVIAIAKEYFEKAADNEEAGGHYNLGVMHLKGIGVKKDVKRACKYFIVAANAGQPKAFYQLAKMFHTGIGLKKNLPMATSLYKLVAERGPWSSLSRWALESYLKGEIGKAFLLYSRMAELGYEVAQSNAAWILDKYGESSMCMGELGLCTGAERHQRAHALWWQASEQGNEHAALLIGDAYYYGRGTERDYERAAEAYMHAKSQSNAQAMFNLGYMHEHGQGLPLDLHLAKRYYDQALEVDAAAKLPVMLALASLWVRRNYADTFLVDIIDSLPSVFPKADEWIKNVIMEEGNATILALFVCLLTVLFLRERQRRHAAPPPQPNDNIVN